MRPRSKRDNKLRLHASVAWLSAALCLSMALGVTAGSAATQAGGPARLLLAESGAEDGALAELRSRFDQGQIDKRQYESAQLRALSGVTPARAGMVAGLRKLRDLWQRGLITELPYYLKRQEFLDAL